MVHCSGFNTIFFSFVGNRKNFVLEFFSRFSTDGRSGGGVSEKK
jgi:hypothetical protein